MRARPTLGPWHVQERSQCFAIVPERGPEITFLYQHGSVTAEGRTYEEIGANAALIATAPDLLTIAQRAVSWLEAVTMGNDDADALLNAARNAIKNATGDEA